MIKADSSIEQLLHAYVDGELGKAEKSRVQAMMRDDERIRERVSELRNGKTSIKRSFEGERAPTRSLPGAHSTPWEMPLLRIAATLLLVVGAFTAGWVGHATRQNDGRQNIALETINPESGHIILHIAESDESRFSHVLAKAEQILRQYENQPVQIEVVANAGGLDLLRTSTSQHAEQIESMMSRYDNVRFVACALGLSKLQEKNLDVRVIEGVHSDQPAADHLIQRLSEGWTYIRI